MVSKKKNHSCEGRIEKSIPRDHCLSSLGKPHDAKRRSMGRIFLSYPQTHDIILDSPMSLNIACKLNKSTFPLVFALLKIQIISCYSVKYVSYLPLSHDVASGSDVTLFNKID